MPNKEISTPHSTGAINRLTLTATEVRGVASNMPGACLACGVCSSCACFDADPQQTSTYGAWNGICFQVD